jgi:hypothetical protein
MARRNRQEQAEATDAPVVEETAAPAAAEPKVAAPKPLCVCGCGSETGKRSAWRQGHDARAKGWLQRVAAGRCFEGERELVEALLGRETRGALKTETFAPLAEAARAAIGLEDENAA